MKVIVLYRPDSEHAREVDQFLHDYNHQTQKTIDKIDVDSREGVAKASVYGVVQYPAFIAMRDDTGQPLKVWEGQPFPLINEVSAYDDSNKGEQEIRQHGKTKL